MNTVDTSASTLVATLKSDLLTELKILMKDMIEERFKELEAVVQTRLSILEQRNSTNDLMPLSVSSELCLKGTSGYTGPAPLQRLEVSQTAKVLRRKQPKETQKPSLVLKKQPNSNSDSREIYMPSLLNIDKNNSLMETKMLGEDILVIKDVTPAATSDHPVV